MDYISVTDLFGSDRINSSTPFIQIKLGNPDKMIYYVDGVEGSRLFRFNRKAIDYALKKVGLDPGRFVSCGDLVFPNRAVLDATFLLVNRRLTQECKRFVKEKRFANGNIFRPVPSKTHTNLALVYARDGFRPSRCFLVDRYVVKKAVSVKGVRPIDRFNYLGVSGVETNVVDLSAHDNDTESLDSEGSWVTSHGRHVKLVQPDTPWYIEKGKRAKDIHTSERVPTDHRLLVDRHDVTGFDPEKKHSEAAPYKTAVGIDPKKHHLGYGYSYLDRLRGVDCREVKADSVYEGFEQPKQSRINYIMHIVMILILVSVVLFAVFQASKRLC